MKQFIFISLAFGLGVTPLAAGSKRIADYPRRPLLGPDVHGIDFRSSDGTISSGHGRQRGVARGLSRPRGVQAEGAGEGEGCARCGGFAPPV